MLIIIKFGCQMSSSVYGDMVFISQKYSNRENNSDEFLLWSSELSEEERMNVKIQVCLVINPTQRKLTEWWKKIEVLTKPVKSEAGSILTLKHANESKCA